MSHHIKHDTTGEWKFNVGAGWASPPWTIDDVGGVLAYNKLLRRSAIDLKTQELIAVGFTYQSKQFSMSINAQINWTNAGLNATGLTYPYRVATKEDNDYYDFVDAADMQGAYGTALTIKSNHLSDGATLKKSINEAIDQAALDAIVDTR